MNGEKLRMEEVMRMITGFIGTYDSPKSKGIYRFTLNPGDGSLSLPELYYEARNAKHLSYQDGMLIAALKRKDDAGICMLGTSGERAVLLDEVFAEEKTPCFVGQDRGCIYTANSDEGIIMVYGKQDGIKIIKTLQLEKEAECHQVLLYKNLLLAVCRGTDSIRIFNRNEEFKFVGEISFPKGSGPRYGVFDKKKRHLFIVTEYSNQLFVVRIDPHKLGKKWKEVPEFGLEQVSSVFEYGQRRQGDSLVVRISSDERYLYVSTRRANLITVFELNHFHVKPVQYASCGGNDPGNFILTPDNRYLLVLNRLSNELVSFEVDTSSGMIKEIKSKVPIYKGGGITLKIE